MDSMIAAASSLFSRSNISQSYNVAGSRSSTPVSNLPTPEPPTMLIGLWRVQSAAHKLTAKRVSVWTFDKRNQDVERLSQSAKDRVIQILKAELSAGSDILLYCVRIVFHLIYISKYLEMVEPLEDTRSELTFATEPVLSSLELAIPGAGKYASLVELDEVEIQKGILQICKGLSFLHTSAQLIHSNINPETIIINASGDWKISGLGLTIPLLQPDGSPTRWEFPTFDGRMPPYIQRSLDYMAPEYALSELLVTASDMYSLGVLIYAVHSKGSPPFKRTHGSLAVLRENSEVGIGMTGGRRVPGVENLDPDLQALFSSLLASQHTTRPTPTTLPSQSFFSSLPISTLNFLDRSNFTSKTREEKVSFMKGLNSVLDRFSEGLKRRKILPSLLEEMKDFSLLPYILPNVFTISSTLSPSQFASTVLPSLKPLFSIKEPPQNMLTLLDNLEMLQSKVEKSVFRGEVLPLVYNALESEHAVVQERALNIIPGLCETIDYAEVSGVLFPKVAQVFTRTRILSIKVATLVTFLAMVKTLDQTILTQKMVPLLSKIRTKEPAVMMATLAVQEAMGFKVDREAVATLVLPQLWAMSMGPLLNLIQFQRFMAVIHKLGERVEQEHDQFLRDSQRLEDRSATAANSTGAVPAFAGSVDFESLVGGKAPANGATQGTSSWDDDVWGSIFNEHSSTPSSSMPAQSLPASPKRDYSPRPSRLASRPIQSSASTVNKGSFASPTMSQKSFPSTSITPMQSTGSGSVLQSSAPRLSPPLQKPNYNISLPPAFGAQASTPLTPQLNYNPSPRPAFSTLPITANTPQPIAMGNILAPSKPATQPWTPKRPGKDDWGDFDPLA